MDCTPEFLGPMAAAVFVGSYQQVRLAVPYQFFTKGDIVKEGLWRGVPYDLTWSCYEGRDHPCGKCPTCIERIEAFRSNGVVDPLKYETSNTDPR